MDDYSVGSTKSVGMTDQTQQPQPASTVMPHGIPSDAAQALALACDVPLQPYDLAALTELLGAGKRCVVVWSPPHSAIAGALRAHTSPSEQAAQWRHSIESLLKLFGRYRRRLLLVDAQMITDGRADDLANLARRLPMKHPLTTHQSTPDLADLLARLMTGQLADLRPVIEELQASSISVTEQIPTTFDLDPVAARLASLAKDRAGLEGQFQDLTTRHREEGDLQRGALADLSSSLTEKAQDLAQAQALRHAAEDRVDWLAGEAKLLREQLRDVSETTATRHANEISSVTSQNMALDQEATLLRNQLAALSDAFATRAQDHLVTSDNADLSSELDLVRAQLEALSQVLAPGEAAQRQASASPSDDTSAELVLLRDQLVALNAELAVRAASGTTSLGSDYPQIEVAFATLLGSLSKETYLRKLAQQDAINATQTLQHLSERAAHLRIRGPVPGRPGTEPTLPFQNDPA